MANEIRKYQNFVGGLVEDNPLTNVATTLNSGGLAALAGVSSAEHMALVLDPDGLGGAPEIVWITSQTSGASSATIARGQEGTTARQHDYDTPWVHALTAQDRTLYGARVRRSTAQSIPNTTMTSVTFDTEVRDHGGLYDSGQPTRLTAPVHGWYQVEGSVSWDTSGTGERQLQLTASSGEVILEGEPAVPAGVWIWMTVSNLFFLAAGQYVQMQAYHAAGAALNIRANESVLSMVRVA